MSRGNKTFLLGILGAAIAWFLGTYLVGIAELTHTTAAGVVDMADPYAISKAVNDPTFTATLSWGTLKLTGLYWALAFPLLLAFGVFIAIVLLSFVTRPRNDRQYR